MTSLPKTSTPKLVLQSTGRGDGSVWVPSSAITGSGGAQGAQGAQGNQGANGSTYYGVSTTVLTLQTGTGTLTTNTNLSFTPGQTVAIAYGSSTYMLATVTSYVSNTGQMNFTVPTTPGSVVGSGT